MSVVPMSDSSLLRSPDWAGLPSASELIDAPELATLAVLDVALSTARLVVLSQNPDIAELDEPGHPWPPPLILCTARLLVNRTEELRDLIAWYRAALDHDRQRRDSDDFPF